MNTAATSCLAPGAVPVTPAAGRAPIASVATSVPAALKKRKERPDKLTKFQWKTFKNLGPGAYAASGSNTGGAAGSSPAPVTPQPSAAQGAPNAAAAAAVQRRKPGERGGKAPSMKYLPEGWTVGQMKIGALQRTNADGSVAKRPDRPWRDVVWPTNSKGESQHRMTDKLDKLPDGSECARINSKRLTVQQHCYAEEYSREYGYTNAEGAWRAHPSPRPLRRPLDADPCPRASQAKTCMRSSGTCGTGRWCR